MSNRGFQNINGYYINFQRLTQKLKELANERGMTQAELAAGITPREHLNKILNGKRNPSLILLYQLCNKLNVDIRLLIEQCYYCNYAQTTHYIHEMKKCITQSDYTRLENLLKECETFHDFKEGIAKQFYIYQQGIIQLKKYHNPALALQYINAALATSFILDEDEYITSNTLSLEIPNIYIDKAICLFKMGSTDEAILLLTDVLHNRLIGYETIETYHLLRAYFYLAYFQFQKRDYTSSLKTSTHGLQLANCKFVYIYTGDLNAIKGLSLYYLKDEQKASCYIDRANEIYTLLNQTLNKKTLKEFIKKNLS